MQMIPIKLRNKIKYYLYKICILVPQQFFCPVTFENILTDCCDS